MDYTKNKVCRICGSRDLVKILDLGQQPLANAFLMPEQFAEEKFFPFEIYFCPSCFLVQTTDVVSPDLLFKDYAYFTNKSSRTMREHFRELSDSLMKFLDEGDLVCDIGSNTGDLLNSFPLGIRILGIDPSVNIAKEAILLGVPTLCEYWNPKTAFEILNRHGKARVITATNVFAHVDNLYEFMTGVKMLLDDNGVFVIEVPYFAKQANNGDYTSYYHEHLSYFLINPIMSIIRRFDMQLFKGSP